MNTSMVKEILHSLVERLETVGSGEIPVTPPGASPAPRTPEVDKAGDIPLDDDKPQIDYEAVGADEVEVNSLSTHKQYTLNIRNTSNIRLVMFLFIPTNLTSPGCLLDP